MRVSAEQRKGVCKPNDSDTGQTGLVVVTLACDDLSDQPSTVTEI